MDPKGKTLKSVCGKWEALYVHFKRHIAGKWWGGQALDPNLPNSRALPLRGLLLPPIRSASHLRPCHPGLFGLCT